MLPHMPPSPIDEVLRHVTRNNLDPLRWAQRILERVAAGENVPLYSEQLAREALRREREPGDDDA